MGKDLAFTLYIGSTNWKHSPNWNVEKNLVFLVGMQLWKTLWIFNSCMWSDLYLRFVEKSVTKSEITELINLVHLFIYGLSGKLWHDWCDSGKCVLTSSTNICTFLKKAEPTYINLYLSRFFKCSLNFFLFLMMQHSFKKKKINVENIFFGYQSVRVNETSSGWQHADFT